jgi:hypothetical protein
MGKLYLCEMEKEFIPYEQALELKELGYDKPCLASWNFYTRELNYNGQPSIFSSEDVIQLPTFSQAFRWFREKHKFDLTIQHNKKYVAIVYSSVKNFSIDEYETYEIAELECLKKLIELVKNK